MMPVRADLMVNRGGAREGRAGGGERAGIGGSHRRRIESRSRRRREPILGFSPLRVRSPGARGFAGVVGGSRYEERYVVVDDAGGIEGALEG